MTILNDSWGVMIVQVAWALQLVIRDIELAVWGGFQWLQASSGRSWGSLGGFGGGSGGSGGGSGGSGGGSGWIFHGFSQFSLDLHDSWGMVGVQDPKFAESGW